MILKVEQKLDYEPLVPWLAGKGRNDYSQFGEDGLIEVVLEKIGTTTRQCFEVGAGDGKTLSNTRRLVEDGWDALWIENSAHHFMMLLRNIPEGGKVFALPAPILPGNCNEMLGEIEGEIDVGVLDIDGEDYWVWQAMEKRPRVMLVEFSPYQEDQERLPKQGKCGCSQAPLGPILDLGKQKGYEPVATTFCNVLFVREELIA